MKKFVRIETAEKIKPKNLLFKYTFVALGSSIPSELELIAMEMGELYTVREMVNNILYLRPTPIDDNDINAIAYSWDVPVSNKEIENGIWFLKDNE